MGTVNANDPRVRRTRQLLILAFQELTREKEIRSISVQDITDRATVNRATFYAHFQDKDAIIETSFRGLFSEDLKKKIVLPSLLTKEHLCLIFYAVCDFIEGTIRQCPKSSRDFHPLVEAIIQEELYAFLEEWFKQELPQKAQERFSPAILATVISWTLFGASIGRHQNSVPLSREFMASQLVSLLAEGLGDALPTTLKDS
jgi:AcrR family transcriptional regulator